MSCKSLISFKKSPFFGALETYSRQHRWKICVFEPPYPTSTVANRDIHLKREPRDATVNIWNQDPLIKLEPSLCFKQLGHKSAKLGPEIIIPSLLCCILIK